MRGFSLFNVVFLAGLLCSVRVMVAGVERDTTHGESVVRARWAVLAGALTLTGFVGSVLVRVGASVPVIMAASAASVALGLWSAQQLVRRAVAMPVSDHEFDPRYQLQGVPAIVVEPITAAADGLVRLPEGAGLSSPMRARSLDGAPIAAGVEVGLERIDDGVAFVEAWSAIEARLQCGVHS